VARHGDSNEVAAGHARWNKTQLMVDRQPAAAREATVDENNFGRYLRTSMDDILSSKTSLSDLP
tara:strand:- start:72610 stop:72801 length:192 start_codon:yes stop_codon:yes gene_type:complete